MSYYSNEDDYRARGIDDDLYYAIVHNPQEYGIGNIQAVLAVHEGEPDADDWCWIIQLNDGRMGVAVGGCDYTGWDCQSGLETRFFSTTEELADGLKHAWSDASYVGDLLQQLTDGKNLTWKERLRPLMHIGDVIES